LKLLFDENLAPSLVAALADIFPQSAHVARIELGAVPDREVWEYARAHHYTLVSKDSDFHELSLLYGSPPKVVWIRRGNCTTRQIEFILRNKQKDIRSLMDSPDSTYLVIL
jgi:predicted nuclease of predicted toxin-antitoxin system